MSRRGFTLIELLVVVSILAVLVAAVFPAYTAIRRSQRVKRVEASVEALAGGVAAYQNDFGIGPPANPPTSLVPAGTNLGNRSVVFFLRLGEAAHGKSAPYLPSKFYNELLQIKYNVLLDEWDRPYVYFDTAAMKSGPGPLYDVLDRAGNSPSPVPPAVKGATDYYNIGGYQILSCGPNQRYDGGRNLHTSEADDIANFVPE